MINAQRAGERSALTGRASPLRDSDDFPDWLVMMD